MGRSCPPAHRTSRYIYDKASLSPITRRTVSTMPGKPAPIKKSPAKKAVKKAPEPEPEPAPVEAPSVEAPPAEPAPAEAAPTEPPLNDACPAPGVEAAPAEEALVADGSAPGGDLLDKQGIFREPNLIRCVPHFLILLHLTSEF